MKQTVLWFQTLAWFLPMSKTRDVHEYDLPWMDVRCIVAE